MTHVKKTSRQSYDSVMDGDDIHTDVFEVFLKSTYIHTFKSTFIPNLHITHIIWKLYIVRNDIG